MTIEHEHFARLEALLYQIQREMIEIDNLVLQLALLTFDHPETLRRLRVLTSPEWQDRERVR